VVSNNSSPVTLRLYSSVKRTLVYKADKIVCPNHDVITEFDCCLSTAVHVITLNICKYDGGNTQEGNGV